MSDNYMRTETDFFKLKHLQFVPVIASFDAKGAITPLYIRLENESYKIYDPKITSKTIDNIRWECNIMVGDFIKTITITYKFTEHAWFIPKYIF